MVQAVSDGRGSRESQLEIVVMEAGGAARYVSDGTQGLPAQTRAGATGAQDIRSDGRCRRDEGENIRATRSGGDCRAGCSGHGEKLVRLAIVGSN